VHRRWGGGGGRIGERTGGEQHQQQRDDPVTASRRRPLTNPAPCFDELSTNGTPSLPHCTVPFALRVSKGARGGVQQPPGVAAANAYHPIIASFRVRGRSAATPACRADRCAR